MNIKKFWSKMTQRTGRPSVPLVDYEFPPHIATFTT